MTEQLGRHENAKHEIAEHEILTEFSGILLLLLFLFLPPGSRDPAG